MANPNWVKGGPSPNPAGKPPGASSMKTRIQSSFIEALEKKGTGKNAKANFTKFLEAFMDEAVAHPESRAAQFVADRLFSGNILSEIDATLQRDRRADMDFMAYRVRKPCFDLQQRVLDSYERVIKLMCGRQAGKTEVDTRKALIVGLQSDKKILFVSLTFQRCIDSFWNALLHLLNEMSIGVTKEDRSNGELQLDNGTQYFFKGNSTALERERLRGPNYDLVIIDEVQSHAALPYLMESIIEPMLTTRGGQLILSGTGPRSRGSYWEALWAKDEGLKLNWNLTSNPYVKDHDTVLAAKRAEHGWAEDNPVYQTEYLGKIAYDDDALVYRLTENNFYKPADLSAWVNSQPQSDIRFVVGMDYGFVDYTAVMLLCYSTHKPETFLIYEKKFNRTGVTEISLALDECVFAMNEASFKNVPANNKKLIGFADTAGGMQSVSYELSTKYHYNILGAMKDNKAFAIEQLQEEVRLGYLKIQNNGPFADEAQKILWARDEQTQALTREIGDDYHPDAMDALLYAFRYIWTGTPSRKPRPETLEKVPDQFYSGLAPKLAT